MDAGALLTASAVAGSAELARVYVGAESHLPGCWPSLTPITACNVLADVPAATSLINSDVRCTEMVIGARYGRRIHLRLMHAAERVLLRRVTGQFARSTSSLGIIPDSVEASDSRCTRVRAARGPWGSWRGARARRARYRLGVYTRKYFDVRVLRSRDRMTLWA